MKATLNTSKVRVEDLEVGDVIRFDTHGGRDARPKWSHWLRVSEIGEARNDKLRLLIRLDNGTGRGVAELLRKLDIVEVQHRSANTVLPIEGA